MGSFSTDQAGNINTTNLDITKELTSATDFTLQPVSSSTNNNSDVIYPALFTITYKDLILNLVLLI